MNSITKSKKRESSQTFLFSLTDMLFSPNRSILMLFDFLILITCFTMATWSSPYGKWGRVEDYLVVSSISFSVAFCAFALGMGYYERTRRYSLYKIFTTGFLSMIISLAVGLMIVYFTYYETFGRLTFLWGAFGAYFGVTFFRTILALIYRSIPYSFSIIGSSAALQEIIKYCTDATNKESRFFKYVAPENLKDDDNFSIEKFKSTKVSDIIFSQDAINDPKYKELGLWAMKNRVRILNEIEFYAKAFERLPLTEIDKAWIFNQGINTRKLIDNFAKRLMDVTLSLLAIVLFLPLFLLICLAIYVEDRGPVFFVQPRMGRYTRPFRMFKFRTMTVATSREDASGGFTKKNDVRVTKVGKLLRPLHLDELPQLINILIGDMSIVGPRPEAVPFARRMSQEIDLYEMRYILRPGLTGHAQILGGYMMDTIEDTKTKLAFDLFYLTHFNFFMDIRVMIRTFFVVIKQLMR